jgi:hypothetical protein
MVLCASAAISKAWRISFLSPGLMRDFKERNKPLYSLRISFFSCSSFKLYFGICATVSMDYEFTALWVDCPLKLAITALRVVCSEPFLTNYL